MIYLLFAFINALPGNDWVRAVKGEINKQAVPFIANPQEFLPLTGLKEALPNLIPPVKELAPHSGIAEADIIYPISKIKLPDKEHTVFTSIDLAIPFPGISRWKPLKRPFELEMEHGPNSGLIKDLSTTIKSSQGHDLNILQTSSFQPMERTLNVKESHDNLAKPNSIIPTIISQQKVEDLSPPSVTSEVKAAQPSIEETTRRLDIKPSSISSHPAWDVNPLTKQIFDRKKNEGLDVKSPTIIKSIFKEVNDIKHKSNTRKSSSLFLNMKMANAEKLGIFQYRFPQFLARGTAVGTPAARMYPAWTVTPSQKFCLDNRQYEGWDVSLLPVIEYIKLEAYNLDLALNNVHILNQLPSIVPLWFFARGRASGIGIWRKYPIWANSESRQYYLDLKQREGWDVSLPKVINYIKEKADSYDELQIIHRNTVRSSIRQNKLRG